MEIKFGVTGRAGACLLAFASGVLAGICLTGAEPPARQNPPPAPEPAPLTPEQREHIRRMEEALKTLNGYGPETAYAPADGGAEWRGEA